MPLKLEQILGVVLNEPSRGMASQEHRVAQHILHEGNVGLDATNLQAVQTHRVALGTVALHKQHWTDS